MQNKKVFSVEEVVDNLMEGVDSPKKVFTEEELKEARKQINHQYYMKNREKKNLQAKIRYWNNPEAKKTRRISDWKRRGIIYFDYNILHELYAAETHCDFCECEFNTWEGGKLKCLDHNHQTGEPRNFLCMKCNIHRKD